MQIASYAQDRKCRLYPSPYETIATSDAPAAARASASVSPPALRSELPIVSHTAAGKRKASQSPEVVTKSLPSSSPVSSKISKAAEESKIKQLEAELAEERRKHSAPDPQIEHLVTEATASAYWRSLTCSWPELTRLCL